MVSINFNTQIKVSLCFKYQVIFKKEILMFENKGFMNFEIEFVRANIQDIPLFQDPKK